MRLRLLLTGFMAKCTCARIMYNVAHDMNILDLLTTLVVASQAERRVQCRFVVHETHGFSHVENEA